jgi:Ni/Co efflux regulator RcnB
MTMRLCALACGLAITLGSASFATALPAAPSLKFSDFGIIQVQDRNWRDGRDRRDRHRMHRHRDSRGEWRRGHRVPPGWRRYGTRPGNWQRRGCIQVGPAWVCP